MRAEHSSLWRDGDFLKLWPGQAICSFSSQITGLALLPMAVLLLGARPGQGGALGGVLALGWVVASPLPRLRDLPTAEAEAETGRTPIAEVA